MDLIIYVKFYGISLVCANLKHYILDNTEYLHYNINSSKMVLKKI